jgi:hypothetical protein
MRRPISIRGRRRAGPRGQRSGRAGDLDREGARAAESARAGPRGSRSPEQVYGAAGPGIAGDPIGELLASLGSRDGASGVGERSLGAIQGRGQLARPGLWRPRGGSISIQRCRSRRRGRRKSSTKEDEKDSGGYNGNRRRRPGRSSGGGHKNHKTGFDTMLGID